MDTEIDTDNPIIRLYIAARAGLNIERTPMDLTRLNSKQFLRHLEKCIQLIPELDATKPSDENYVLGDPIGIMNLVSENPIKNEDDVLILRKGIEYMMTDPAVVQKTVQDVLDQAFDEAIPTADGPLEAVLLALARHTIKAKRIDLMSA